MIKAALGGYLKEIRKDFEQSGLPESQIVSDYQSANVIGKNIRIGRLFTYNAQLPYEGSYSHNIPESVR